MYELNIANKNYSSWSLRPWVLMRELAIPFEEHVVRFDHGTAVWPADNGVRAWARCAAAETWREPSHEEEARRAGAWLEDLRRSVP